MVDDIEIVDEIDAKCVLNEADYEKRKAMKSLEWENHLWLVGATDPEHTILTKAMESYYNVKHETLDQYTVWIFSNGTVCRCFAVLDGFWPDLKIGGVYKVREVCIKKEDVDAGGAPCIFTIS